MDFIRALMELDEVSIEGSQLIVKVYDERDSRVIYSENPVDIEGNWQDSCVNKKGMLANVAINRAGKCREFRVRSRT